MSEPLTGDACLLRLAADVPNAPLLLVEGVRLTGWKVVQEEVDVTTAADEGWRMLLSHAGLRSLEVSVAGLYLGSPGELLLRNAALTGAVLSGELSLDQGQSMKGSFLVSCLSMRSEVDEEASYEAVLRSAGPIELV